MAKLYLKFEQAVLKEIPLSQYTMTIGRLPDNHIQVDNPAVSGHHARLTWDGSGYVLEDTNSLNGTYVNNHRIAKTVLKDGDNILVGKHTLAFKTGVDQPGAASAAPAGPKVQALEATMMLDTKAAKQMLAATQQAAADRAEQKPTDSTAVTSSSEPAAKERTAVLSILEGKTDETQYVLASKMSAIGKSEMASIKLTGWFAPPMAAVINKRDAKYFIAASDLKHRVKINGEEISGLHELKDGDQIEVANVKMVFGYQD